MHPDRRICNAILRHSLFPFVQRSFMATRNGQMIETNFYLDAICHALEKVARGEIQRLLIIAPPRSLKSFIASVAFPGWKLLMTSRSKGASATVAT